MARTRADAGRERELTLDQFGALYLDDRKGEFLPYLGPTSHNVLKSLKNKALLQALRSRQLLIEPYAEGDVPVDQYRRRFLKHHAAAMLATNFWRAWIGSETAERTLRRHGASPCGMDRRRLMIHPRRHLERFDLFVFDPGLGADFVPKIIDVSESISESELQFAANLVSVTAPLRYIWEQAPQAARESLRDGKQPFSVLLAASPGYEKLFVPSSPLDVYSVSIGQHSTAGVVVEDLTKQGRIGVTAARHGIGSKPSKVTVNGQTGTVVRVHEITDSAFIEVPRPTRAAKSTHGIMRGFAPRGNQNADFVGVTTAKTTRIMTWDPQVPDPSPVRQACVYTGRDAQPGDSGCALVTDDDWIVGFAFERTIPGANPIYCSWIWAESVMNGLQVKLVLVGRSE